MSKAIFDEHYLQYKKQFKEFNATTHEVLPDEEIERLKQEYIRKRSMDTKKEVGFDVECL